MSNRDFMIFVGGLKSTLGNLNGDQWERLLQKAVQDYGLTAEEATQILEDLELKVINYCEVLGLNIEDLQHKSETEIETLVQNKYNQLYKNAIDSKASGAVKNLLIEAKSILKDPQKRREHIAVLHEFTNIRSDN